MAQRAAQRAAVNRPVFSKQAWVRPAGTIQEKEVTMKQRVVSAAVAAVMTLGMGGGAAGSTAVPVNTSPRENRLWETIQTNTLDLAWRWREDADTARLTIAEMGGPVLETNLTRAVSNVLWQVPGTQTTEELYELVLTFYDGDSAVVGAQTSRLARIATAQGTIRVDADPGETQWRRIKQNAVIPYDAGWTAATDGAVTGRLAIARTGLSRTFNLPDPAGYFGWRVKGSDWGYGTFSLALDFPGTVTNTWDAVLIRIADGTLIQMH